MSFTVEQKNQLAKLMATENLRIEHQNLQTAMFDPKNRVMYLPIWKDMKGTMYDLLTGHEVGHALYTPPDGWHHAVFNIKDKPNFKNFLNVVEDARIEKKIQRKYPGLRKSFREAYKQLMDRDFFGLHNRDINEIPFIDRLNILTKSQYSLHIKFTEFEETLIEKVKALETWDDVLRVTEEIYNYSRDEQLEKHEEFYVHVEIEEYEHSWSKPSKGKSDENESDGDSTEEDEEGSSKKTEDENLKEESTTLRKINRHKVSEDSDEDQFHPECQTDETYRQRESDLVFNTNKQYLYLKFPKANVDNCFTPAKRVQELLTDYYRSYNRSAEDEERTNDLIKEFKSRNEKYISLLVKEFEMKKAAKSYENRRVSDTGDLDINKLSNYKFEDNIFRRMTTVPKGKSHGLMLLLDYSRSMSENMAGSIEQILILTTFCRKVNIPFVVYTFSNNKNSIFIDRAFPCEKLETVNFESFKFDDKDLYVSNVRIREYLNSDMTTAEFNKAMRNMVRLQNSYEHVSKRFFRRPPVEDLTNTPLMQGLLVCAPLMKQFRAKYNLDNANLVIVHDGDSDYTNSYYENGITKSLGGYGKSQEITIFDKNNGFRESFEYNYDTGFFNLFVSALKWFTHETQAKIFGFYILPQYNTKYAVREKYYDKNGNSASYDPDMLDNAMAFFRKNRYVISYRPGYEAFFFIPGGDELKVDEDGFVIEEDASLSKIKTAFVKYNKKKQVSRVLVSRFIEGIAV